MGRCGWDNAVDGFQVHELAATVSVRATRAMDPLPPALDRRVETLWQNAARRVEAGGVGRLFNGRVFSVDVITPTAIRGHFTEYRRLVAQMEDHALFAELGIGSLSVCGVLSGPDGVAIGRRPAAAIYQPGMWQLPPAGSVDSSALRAERWIDLKAQLLTELCEELGLDPADVGDPTPLCVVEHPGSHVSDLGMAITTRLTASEIKFKHQANGNAEYDPLLVVGLAELPEFLRREGSAVVPPAFEFLRRAGLFSTP
jgi:hypothetical protein